jgi:hypothetical protein
MSTTAPAYPTTPTAGTGARLVPLRIGLVLCAVLLVMSAVPALDVGLDGSGWDIVVISLAVAVPAAALATLVLVPFAWRGARRPALAVALVQVVSNLQTVPVLLLPAGTLPAAAVVAVLGGTVLSLVAAGLVLVGRRRR